MENNKSQHQDIFDFNQELGSIGKRESISLGIATMPATGNNGSSSSLFIGRDSEDSILSKWSQQGATDYTILNNLGTMPLRVSPIAQSRGSNEDLSSMVMKVYALLNLGNMPVTVSQITQPDTVTEDTSLPVLYETTQAESATNNSNNSTVPVSSVPVYQMSGAVGQVSPVSNASTTADWYSLNLKDAEIISSARMLGADNNLSRTDFISIFQTVSKNSSIDGNELADLKTLTSVSTAPFTLSNDVRFLASKVAQGTTLDMKAADFDSTLVGKWFLGTVAPTASFSHKNSPTTMFTYTSLKGTLFGSTGTAQIGDINQGQFGDCSFLAALGSTFAPQSNDASQSVSKTINDMIIDNQDNTYSVKFYDKGKAEYVTVDRRVATVNGRIYGASKGTWNPNKDANINWAPLVERAYAQWREDKTGKPGYDAIGHGDWIGNPLGYITGRTVTSYSASKTTFSIIQSALAKGQAVETGASNSNDYVVGNHAYSVTNAYVDADKNQRVVIRNPWGVDGVKVGSGNRKDGFVDLSFNDFNRYLNGVSIA